MNTIALSSGSYFGNELQKTHCEEYALSLTQYDGSSVLQPHYHENCYLSILIQGHYQEQSQRLSQSIIPGEIIFRPAGYQHTNLFDKEGGKCFNIEFSRPSLDDLELNLPADFCIYPSGSLPLFYRLVLSENTGLRAISVDECIIDWLSDTRLLKDSVGHLPCDRVIQIIHDEPRKNHALTELSELAQVHPVYLSRAFKKKTGTTISEYQHRTKLQRAFQLVISGDDSISRISYSCGFFDDAHFIRSFKAYYGFAPHHFRLRLRG